MSASEPNDPRSPDDDRNDVSDDAEIRQERARVRPRPPSHPVRFGDEFELPPMKPLEWIPCANGCGQEVLKGSLAECHYCEKKAVAELNVEKCDAALRLSLAGDPSECSFGNQHFAARFLRPNLLDHAKALSEARWIVFVGSGSTGKTSLAKAMLLHWFQRHKGSALMVPAPTLKGFDLEEDLLSLDHVLLDDLGEEKDIKTNLAPQIIRERRRMGKRLWVTTGLTRDQVYDRYGEGIGRRVFGSSGDVTVMNFNTGEIS